MSAIRALGMSAIRAIWPSAIWPEFIWLPWQSFESLQVSKRCCCGGVRISNFFFQSCSDVKCV